jgi:hypothetical protein
MCIVTCKLSVIDALACGSILMSERVDPVYAGVVCPVLVKLSVR